MSELEDTLSRILSDKDSMAKIAALAQSLGQEKTPEQQQTPDKALPESGKLMGALIAAGAQEKSYEPLLSALKPFLAPERSEKLDTALQAAKLAKLAKALLSGS